MNKELTKSRMKIHRSRDLERESREKKGMVWCGVVDWDEDEIWCHVRLRVFVCCVMSSCTHSFTYTYICSCRERDTHSR